MGKWFNKKLATIIVVIAVLILISIYILPIAVPLIVALLTAIFLEPFVKFIQKRFKWQRKGAVITVFILFLLIKKQKSPFINKFRLIGVHYLVSFAFTCAVVFFPAIYKSSINALNSGYWAIAVECITIPIFYLTYRYRIMSGDKNMDSNHRDNVQ